LLFESLKYVNQLNKSKSSLYRNIRKLKELDVIERVGADKNGYWKVKI